MAKKKIKRPKRLQRKQEQKNLLDDLIYYQQRGELDTDESRQNALSTALGDSAEWYADPEFEPIRFKPLDAGMAMVAGFTEAEVPDMQALQELPEEEREQKTYLLRMVATQELVNPKIQQATLDALDKFRKRLRKGKDFKKVAQAALIHDMLKLGMEQNEMGPLLAFGIWQVALDLGFDDFLVLMGARQQLLDDTKEEFGLISSVELSYGPVTESDTWLKAVEETEGLADFIYEAGQREYYEALRYVALGAIDINPFTEDETAQMHKILENVAEPFEEMPRLARALLNLIDTGMRRDVFMNSVREQLEAIDRTTDPNLTANVDTLRAITQPDENDANIELANNDIAYVIASRQLSNLVWLARREAAQAAEDNTDANNGEKEAES